MITSANRKADIFVSYEWPLVHNSLKLASLWFFFVSPQLLFCQWKINSGWTVVWEEGGFAKRCYWSLYSWNNLYGLATAASSLINVCQKPGTGLPGVKALRNNASHHRQEWQKTRNEKEDCREVGRRGRRRRECRMIEAGGGEENTMRESNFWDPQRRRITW